MSLTLYYHPLSSFCHKVLVALYENGHAFDKRLINLGDSADRAMLGAIWPFLKFPVLHDAARNLDWPESTVIIEYLDRYYAGSRLLIPSNGDEALQVRLWDRICDNHLQVPMQAIVADRMMGSTGNMDRQRSMIMTSYRMIEDRMGSRKWLAGEEFSLADCAAAPALFYANCVEPFPGECQHLASYFDRLALRPSFKRVLEEAKPYFSMFPFKERIPARFL